MVATSTARKVTSGIGLPSIELRLEPGQTLSPLRLYPLGLLAVSEARVLEAPGALRFALRAESTSTCVSPSPQSKRDNTIAQ